MSPADEGIAAARRDATEAEDKIRWRKSKIRGVLEAAQEAFWARVVEAFPQARMGDFDPIEDLRFDQACEAAIEHWVDLNVPKVRLAQVTIPLPEGLDLPDKVFIVTKNGDLVQLNVAEAREVVS